MCRHKRVATTPKQSNHLYDQPIWLFGGRGSPFLSAHALYMIKKCTVYVEGLKWGFFVRYSVFAWENSLPSWNWPSAVKSFKFSGQAVYFKAMLNFETGFSASEVTLVPKNIFFLKMLNFVQSLFVEWKVSLADGTILRLGSSLEIQRKPGHLRINVKLDPVGKKVIILHNNIMIKFPFELTQFLYNHKRIGPKVYYILSSNKLCDCQNMVM
jgi:hypothetical protein